MSNTWALLRSGMNISGVVILPAVKISGTGKYQERAKCPFHMGVLDHFDPDRKLRVRENFCEAKTA
ncbi:MAG: hypothetical protein F6K48_28995 [Okeania sp. SIO3H1]|nr:hypothetical protein [Okeania sp. SIO3H1]